MRCALSSLAAAAALLVGGASGAAADITPEEVWQAFTGHLARAGYRVEGALRRDGSALEVAGASARLDLPEDSGQVRIDLGDIRLNPLGDGRVAVDLPGTMPIHATVTDPESGITRMRLDQTFAGVDLVVSGDADAPVYDFEVEALSLALAELEIDGAAIPPQEAAMRLEMERLVGEVSIATEGTLQTVSQSMTAQGLAYATAFAEPGGQSTATLTGRLRDLDFTGAATLPLDVDGTDFAAMLRAGFDVEAQFSHEGGDSSFGATDETGSTTGTTTSGAGRFRVALDADALAYDLAARDVTYALAVPDLPFPVTAGAAGLGLEISMPALASETPQPADLSFKLEDLVLSDALWAMLDPQGALPRDPATAALDLSATVTPFVDLFDAQAMADPRIAETGPGEINALSLDRLDLRLAGAELTGTGSFTFDNSDLERFDGMPAPEGEATFFLSGADALIDTLVAMGLVPETQAMGARMMLSMFAKPAGEDRLTSTIIVNEEGHVLANGQRIR